MEEGDEMTYYSGPSPAQHKTLIFISAYIVLYGYPPTFREMADHFGGISTNAVNDRLIGLERKGYISTPEDKRSRSIRITIKGKEYLRNAHDRHMKCYLKDGLCMEERFYDE